MIYQAPRDGAPVYELNTRIRYSEVNHRGTLTIPALINCFQDCSTFQSAEIGMNIGKLHEERQGWVLTHWQIVIDRYPGLCEHVVVGTFPSSFKGVAATRFFYMRDAQGELVARARSTWAFMDFGKGRLMRPDPELVKAYGTAEPLAMPDEERRVRVPAAPTPCEPLTVRLHQIDTNEHVNNGQYVQMALEVLPRELDPMSIRVDYRRAAVLDDTIYPMVGQEDGRFIVALNGSDGEPYAVVEFTSAA